MHNMNPISSLSRRLSLGFRMRDSNSMKAYFTLRVESPPERETPNTPEPDDYDKKDLPPQSRDFHRGVSREFPGEQREKEPGVKVSRFKGSNVSG